MRFSTHFPLGCAAALALSLPCWAADDAGGQVQAGQALRLPMGGAVVSQAGQTTTGSLVSQPGRAPVLLAQAPDSAAVERAREQLRQKMSELEAQQGGTAPTNPAARTVTPPAAAPAGNAPLSQAKEEELRRALEVAMQQTPPSGSPAASAADATRKAKAELKARTKAEARKKPAPPQTPPKTVPAQPAVAAAAQQAATTAAAQGAPAEQRQIAFPPIQGPPLPISAEQQRRLAELLVRYMADQVTPEEYQRERAKILSEK